MPLKLACEAYLAERIWVLDEREYRGTPKTRVVDVALKPVSYIPSLTLFPLAQNIPLSSAY